MLRPRPVATWLLIAVAVALSLAFLAQRLAGTSDASEIPFYADAWMATGVRVDVLPGATSGLVAGDVVLAIDGRPLGAWIDGAANPGLDRSGLAAPGVPYAVQRAGEPMDIGVALASYGTSGRLAEYWSVLLFMAILQVVAGYVLWRRPALSAATALALGSVGVTGSTIPWLLGLQAIDVARGWPFALYGATAGGLYMLVWPAAMLHLPLALTAQGSPSRRLVVALYAVPLGAYALLLLAARLVAVSSVAWVGTWATVQVVVVVPTVAVGLGLLVRRYRAASAPVRRQTRWAAFAIAVSVAVTVGLLFVPQLLTGRPIVQWSALGVLALPIPVAIGAAILRRGLFDFDVVVNRTLVYAGATVAIVAVYVASVTTVGIVLGINAGLPSALLATAIAAVVALPIRDALQRLVDRVMYGDRDDPYRALTRLGRRFEASLDPGETPDVIVRTVAESLRLPWVALRIGSAAAVSRTVVHGGPPPEDPVDVPVVYGAEVVGDLLVAPRGPDEPLSHADRSLLEDLARQAGAAVHAHALTLDLIASRERLVGAREEERRRIRRDLHDGLGPTLAAIGLRAEMAADLAGRDPAESDRILQELRAGVRGALADIRRLVDALRPPALDDVGLAGALAAQADHLGPPPVFEVAAPVPLPELPAAVEVAAFRIAVEAMTNVARHAGATTCRVRLEMDEDGRALSIDVADDGRGLPQDLRPGIGIVSMRQRASEVGGTLGVGPGDGGGTRVRAVLPIDIAWQQGGGDRA